MDTERERGGGGGGGGGGRDCVERVCMHVCVRETLC